MSVKIQFIRRDGKIIECLAERFDISADRAVGVFPVPVTGERVGTDMNQVSTKVEIDGVILDDEANVPSATATPAIASINFTLSTTKDAATWSATFAGVMAARMASLHAQLTNYNGTSIGATIEFVTETQAAEANGNKFVFEFTDAGAGGAHAVATPAGNIGVSLTAGSMVNEATGYAHIATRLHNSMTTSAVTETDAIAAGAAGTFASAITATLAAVTGYGNAQVNFVQTVTGVASNGLSPTFWTPDQQQIDGDGFLSLPRHQLFYGGSISSRKSAGDKVQDLYAAVANNNIFGAVGTILDNSAVSGLSFDLTDLTGRGETFVSSYIIGIKVPYESLKQSTNADPVIRNFILLTGMGNRGDADANTSPFSTEFDWQNKKTGIMGTVTSFSAEQQGGQKYFDFTATFQPLDMIVGF